MQIRKYVIYTAVIGDYDHIEQPRVIDDRFDYILFSDSIDEEYVGIWKIRRVNYYNKVQTKIARYVKTHPEELLPEYDFSVWIDSNICIVTPYIYERSVELYKNNSLIATVWHTSHQCIYDESFLVLALKFEQESIILDWCHRLQKEKYPKDNGLCETGLMFRVHSKQQVRMLDQLWWNCIDSYSRRDQLSFNYVLWKLGIAYEFFLPKTMNVWISPDFEYFYHANDSQKYIPAEIEPWLIRYYRKVPNSYNEIKNIYFFIYKLPFPCFFSYLLGQIYRMKYFLVRQKQILINIIRKI